MVTGHNHECVLEASLLLQEIECRSHLPVEPFNLHVVIQNIASNDLIVGEMWRYAHVLQPFPRGDSGVLRKWAMRIGATQPESKWFVRGKGFQEGCKIFESGPGRVEGSPSRLQLARCPAFARMPDHIAVLFQQLRVDLELNGQCAV